MNKQNLYIKRLKEVNDLYEQKKITFTERNILYAKICMDRFDSYEEMRDSFVEVNKKGKK